MKKNILADAIERQCAPSSSPLPEPLSEKAAHALAMFEFVEKSMLRTDDEPMVIVWDRRWGEAPIGCGYNVVFAAGPLRA